MHFLKTGVLLFIAAAISNIAVAQTDEGETDSTSSEPSKEKRHMEMRMSMGNGPQKPSPVRHWYVGNSVDGAIFSTAIFEKPGRNQELTPVRFSLINFGYHFNYDFDEHFGMYTGLGIKNIGFIEKIGDSTIKRRVYTIGVPLGFKLGNLQKRHYGFVGGGVDVPWNYREKGFVNRRDKQKFNEFWSDRTERFMPYLFAGFAYGKGSTLKLQYYPGNFFDTDYEETRGGITTRPYRGYSAHLLYVTLGVDFSYKSNAKKIKPDEDDAPAPAPAEM